MWPFKQNKKQKLENKYKKFLEQARDIQRSGDLKAYAKKIMEAKVLEDQIIAIETGYESSDTN